MRRLKVNSQKEAAGRRTIGTRNSKETASKPGQNDRNNIGKRIGAGTMPRTRRSVAQSKTPSAATTSVTSPQHQQQNRIPKVQNGQPRNSGKMELLLKQRDEVLPCMTGSDRVANWKSSTQYAIEYYKNEVIVSPRKQAVQRSSIQERISYGKVSSSTTFGCHTSSGYDFKVPSTIQRNDNSVELIDLTDDASESNTSSITTQEELYSYLGVVTKSQTSKVDTETENKTVKRSSLRVKVKQIALRNQEIYNQLENNRKMEAAMNTQSLVRYNGHRIEQSSVQVKRQNGDPRSNQYTTKHQQYTQATYKSTTLVNNTTNSQQQPSSSRTSYRTVATNRVNQQQFHSSSSSSSNQLVPYPFKPSTRARNSSNKCTVMERFVYKPTHEANVRPIQVNADKYKTSILTSSATSANRLANGQPPIGSRPTAPRIGEVSPTRKPEALPSRDNRPPQITPGIKRKAMEQWIELSSTHPTSTNNSNNLQSRPNTSTTSTSSSAASASFTSFHHQNMTTTTNISTHRKIQKVDVSIYVNNVGTSNTFQTNNQLNAAVGNVSPQRKIQIDPRKRHLQAQGTQVVSVANGNPSPRLPQPSNATRNANIVQPPASIQSPTFKNIRPSNALALQTCSQKNIGNNRVSKRRLSPKLSTELAKAIVREAHAMKPNVAINNTITPRTVQNLNSSNVSAGNTYSPHGNTSAMHTNQPRTVSSNKISPNVFSRHDPRVSSSAMPVMQNIAVSKVSSMQTSSQQYISSNGNDKRHVAIEVTVQSNFNSKRASSMQLRAIQNIEAATASSSEKNSQQNVDAKHLMPRVNIKSIDPNRVPTVQLIQLRPIQHIVASSLSSPQNNSHQNIINSTSGSATLKTEQKVNVIKSTSMQQSGSMQNILLLPTSSMETKNVFQRPVFDNQSEIQVTSTDLNENVAKDNKSDIPMDLSSSSSINHVPIAKRDSKTNSMDDDVKPCLTVTPLACENVVNESDCTESKPFEIPAESQLNSNFLHRIDGDVLSVLSLSDHIVVIQERLISFWTMPSELLSIFGMEQRYVCTGKMERYNCDIEIDTPYQHRLLVVGNRTFYVELRAKKLSGTYTRESLMSIYLTLYSLNDQQELILRHIELDRVHGSIPSIRYTILPRSRSFVICWCEGVTNVRKYNLNANMLNLDSVLIFPGCREYLKKLQFFENDTVIAFGHSTITMWDSRSGDITCKIDTSPIGDNLHFFSLNENTERALFLIQSCADPIGNGQLIKLLAINMNKNYSWKVISTHKMPSNGSKITSMATITNHFITTYENGQSFLLNLCNPRQFVVHSSEAKGAKCFVTNDKIIAIDYNKLVAKTFVDHFFG